MMSGLEINLGDVMNITTGTLNLSDVIIGSDLVDIKHEPSKTILVFCLTHDDKRFEYNLYKSQPNASVIRTNNTIKIHDTLYKFVCINLVGDGLCATGYIMSKQLRSFGKPDQLEKAKFIGDHASKYSQ